MGRIEDELEELKKSIKRGHQSMVLVKYQRLFELVTDEAIDLLNSDRFKGSEIELNCHNGLTLRKDGRFYHNGHRIRRSKMDQLAEVYKDESVYNQVNSGVRYHKNPKGFLGCRKQFSVFQHKHIIRPPTEEALECLILELHKKTKKIVSDTV